MLKSFICIVCILGGFCYAIAAPPKVIVIDPGHGGKDPGTNFNNISEKDITLAVGLLVQKMLKEQFPDIRTEITRDTDIYEHVTEKAEKANKWRGELFVSIHVNSATPHRSNKYKYVTKSYYTKVQGKRVKKTKKVKQYLMTGFNNDAEGVEVYIWASDRADNKTEAISSTYEGHGEETDDEEELPDLNSPETRLLSQMYAQKFFQSSFRVATLIDEELMKIGRVSRGVKQRNDKGIWVLQATAMPAVLVELGYVTHQKEAQYMASAQGQEELAAAIVSGIARYIGH